MGVSEEEMSEKIREAAGGLAVPTSFDQAVSLMMDVARGETVQFFMAGRGVGGPDGQVTLDVVAVTERRLLEIELYGEQQNVRLHSFSLNAVTTVVFLTEKTPAGERTTVHAFRADGLSSEWSGGEELSHDLRSLAAHLLRRAGASSDGGLRHAHVV